MLMISYSMLIVCDQTYSNIFNQLKPVAKGSFVSVAPQVSYIYITLLNIIRRTYDDSYQCVYTSTQTPSQRWRKNAGHVQSNLHT